MLYIFLIFMLLTLQGLVDIIKGFEIIMAEADRKRRVAGFNSTSNIIKTSHISKSMFDQLLDRGQHYGGWIL